MESSFPDDQSSSCPVAKKCRLSKAPTDDVTSVGKVNPQSTATAKPAPGFDRFTHDDARKEASFVDLFAGDTNDEDDRHLLLQLSSVDITDGDDADAVEFIAVKPPPLDGAAQAPTPKKRRTVSRTASKEVQAFNDYDVIDLTDENAFLMDIEESSGKNDGSLNTQQDFEHAFGLQSQVEKKGDGAKSAQRDFAIARGVQTQFEQDEEAKAAKTLRTLKTHQDFAIARDLQIQFEMEEEEAKIAETLHKDRMLKTPTGKAWTFVEGVLDIFSRLSARDVFKRNPTFAKPVATDDIVALTERLLVAQAEFREAGKPFQIDLGYHYTKSHNLATIRTVGLLTKREREHRRIASTFNGSAFGDGIYTSISPREAWNQRYGNTGLLVARLRGRERVFTERPAQAVKDDPNFDSVKHGWISVLRGCCQCVPLIQYDGDQLKFDGPASCLSGTILAPVQKQLQDLIDKLLNSDS